MEKRFCQRQVLLPISESVFQFDATRLKDTNVGQFTAVGIEFQQHFIELLVNWGYGSFQIVFRLEGDNSTRYCPACRAGLR
jgi:hypothetical protein